MCRALSWRCSQGNANEFFVGRVPPFTREHQKKLYEESRKGLTVNERRKADQLEQALKSNQTFDDTYREKTKLIMPQIVNEKAWSDQGRIDMPEMMKLLKISQNKAYRIRRELLKHYHEQKSLRGS